jgi:uncharacterized Zn ribbon protein
MSSAIKVNIGTKFSETTLAKLSTDTTVPKDREPIVVKDAGGKVIGTVYGDGVTALKDLKLIGKDATLSNDTTFFTI